MWKKKGTGTGNTLSQNKFRTQRDIAKKSISKTVQRKLVSNLEIKMEGCVWGYRFTFTSQILQCRECPQGALADCPESLAGIRISPAAKSTRERNQCLWHVESMCELVSRKFTFLECRPFSATSSSSSHPPSTKTRGRLVPASSILFSYIFLVAFLSKRHFLGFFCISPLLSMSAVSSHSIACSTKIHLAQSRCP